MTRNGGACGVMRSIGEAARNSAGSCDHSVFITHLSINSSRRCNAATVPDWPAKSYTP